MPKALAIQKKTDSSRVALVLCRWNTLLIVLVALGLSRHCRQKCDVSGTIKHMLQQRHHMTASSH